MRNAPYCLRKSPPGAGATSGTRHDQPSLLWRRAPIPRRPGSRSRLRCSAAVLRCRIRPVQTIRSQKRRLPSRWTSLMTRPSPLPPSRPSAAWRPTRPSRCLDRLRCRLWPPSGRQPHLCLLPPRRTSRTGTSSSGAGRGAIARCPRPRPSLSSSTPLALPPRPARTVLATPRGSLPTPSRSQRHCARASFPPLARPSSWRPSRRLRDRRQVCRPRRQRLRRRKRRSRRGRRVLRKSSTPPQTSLTVARPLRGRPGASPAAWPRTGRHCHGR
mmetsp:Transcript_29570/g.95503  ORF Transcript_29570/g.95503 Transcript_29570/m.95503 type:complete len:272 (-) Transcript_29570:818-1633(-)